MAELDIEAYRDAPRPRAPWVLANMVMGVDGAVTIDGRVGELNSPADRELFRAIRLLSDVILVGASTVREEHYGPSVRPIAIVTNSIQLDLGAPLFAEPKARPIIVTSDSSPADARERAAEVADVIVAGGSSVDMRVAVTALHERGHGVILTEGGPSVLAELLLADLVDELCLTIAPIAGGDPGRMVGDSLAGHLVRFALAGNQSVGDDVFLRYLRRGEA
ncbi:MAG TPA: dihydrofolate reductase family protein [Acidimicrobiales bacterium]|nr:dihydrofolate reductase family protein [Acidimicrobiales bacterium]